MKNMKEEMVKFFNVKETKTEKKVKNYFICRVPLGTEKPSGPSYIGCDEDIYYSYFAIVEDTNTNYEVVDMYNATSAKNALEQFKAFLREANWAVFA